MSNRKRQSLLVPLGVGFVMASSASLQGALGMSVAVMVALTLSAAAFSALERMLPAGGKLPVFLLLVTGFVSLLQMLAEAHFPEVTGALGVHLAALSVSLVPYCAQAENQEPMAKPTVKAALSAGLLFALLMVVCGVIREVLGSAAIFGASISFLQDYRISALSGVFGGYLVLSIVLAVMKKLTGKTRKEGARQ